MLPGVTSVTSPVDVTVVTRPDDDALRSWDELVAESPGSDVCQLSGWAAVRRRAGYGAWYVFAWHGDRLVGGAQLYLRRLPLLGEIGYLPYGPVLRAGTEPALRQLAVATMADVLETLARRRLRALFVQPTDGDDVTRALRARGFRDSTAGVAPPATVRVDLAPDEDALRAGLSKRIRRWTGKWAGSGVTVRRGGPDDLDVLSDLTARSASYQGYSRLSEETVRTMYRELSDGGHVELFIGEVEGRPVAAELFTACGGVLRPRLTGMDRSSSAVRLSVASAVDWEAIRWAKRNGFREFDLGGLTPAAAEAIATEGFSSSSLDGSARMKVAFGGRLHRYPAAMELISSPVLRFGYDVLTGSATGRGVVNLIRTWLRSGGRPTR